MPGVIPFVFIVTGLFETIRLLLIIVCTSGKLVCEQLIHAADNIDNIIKNRVIQRRTKSYENAQKTGNENETPNYESMSNFVCRNIESNLILGWFTKRFSQPLLFLSKHDVSWSKNPQSQFSSNDWVTAKKKTVILTAPCIAALLNHSTIPYSLISNNTKMQ